VVVGSRSAGRRAEPSLETAASAPKGGPAAIAVSGVNKTFRIPDHRYTTLKERILNRRSTSERTLDALRDVSFEVGQGEFFGILGRNGSGKSTLLKTIAGILHPDSGTIDTRGTVSPMLALGAGFQSELAARDNVLINGALMGIGRREMLRRFPAILEFAELEEFEELPLKNYSSGMLLRLAFSAGIHVDAQILLLDEILAVGDLEFQEKCFERFHSLKREGKTIVLVSHGLEMITQFGDRAMLLDHGSVISIGEPERIVNDYTTTSIEDMIAQSPETEERWGDGTAEIVEVWCEGSEGKRTSRFQRGEEITVKVRARFHESLADTYVGFSIRDHTDQLVFEVSDRVGDDGRVRRGSEAVFAGAFEGWFNPGHYALWPIIARVGDATHLSDLRAGFARFMVEGESQGSGPMYPPTRTHVEMEG
jgi:ABC-type polysaccharide/polyol phosphate transport system ATPase subunit